MEAVYVVDIKAFNYKEWLIGCQQFKMNNTPTRAICQFSMPFHKEINDSIFRAYMYLIRNIPLTISPPYMSYISV